MRVQCPAGVWDRPVSGSAGVSIPAEMGAELPTCCHTKSAPCCCGRLKLNGDKGRRLWVSTYTQLFVFVVALQFWEVLASSWYLGDQCCVQMTSWAILIPAEPISFHYQLSTSAPFSLLMGYRKICTQSKLCDLKQFPPSLHSHLLSERFHSLW